MSECVCSGYWSPGDPHCECRPAAAPTGEAVVLLPGARYTSVDAHGYAVPYQPDLPADRGRDDPA